LCSQGRNRCTNCFQVIRRPNLSASARESAYKSNISRPRGSFGVASRNLVRARRLERGVFAPPRRPYDLHYVKPLDYTCTSRCIPQPPWAPTVSCIRCEGRLHHCRRIPRTRNCTIISVYKELFTRAIVFLYASTPTDPESWDAITRPQPDA